MLQNKFQHTSSPFGRNVTAVTSDKISIVSWSVVVSKQFHIFIVLSHEPDTNVVDVVTAGNDNVTTGPSWPLRISNKRPTFIDHKNISNTSCPPAATNSPEWSMATHENCTGRGEVNVRKLRYL